MTTALQEPAKKNMKKGIWLAYTIIGATYIMLAIAGTHSPSLWACQRAVA